MAVKKEDIWNQVVTILSNAMQGTGSLNYVKELLQGTREDIPKFPVIVLEPIRDTEVQHTVPEYKRITFEISITGWIEVYNKDKQILGEEQDKGILDIERDIKNELDKYQDLNGNCIKFWFPSTSYVFGFETFPYRSVEIVMAIEFITQARNR